MARPRKLVQIKTLVDKANKFFESSEDHQNVERQAIQNFVSNILHDNNAYSGFNYRYWLFGGGCEQWQKDGEPSFPEKDKYFGDQTRIFFYAPKSL